MTTFLSCHLIVNRKLPDDRRHVSDFLDADSFRWGSISTLFLEWTPSTNTNIFSCYYAHMKENVKYFYRNDSSFTVKTGVMQTTRRQASI